MAVRSGVYGNCLNVINNCSACSVLFLSTPALSVLSTVFEHTLFLALRKTLDHSTASRALKFFCLLETTLSCSKNSSTEHAEALFIALLKSFLEMYLFCRLSN